jgi:hypothetical protein
VKKPKTVLEAVHHMTLLGAGVARVYRIERLRIGKEDPVYRAISYGHPSYPVLVFTEGDFELLINGDAAYIGPEKHTKLHYVKFSWPKDLAWDQTLWCSTKSGVDRDGMFVRVSGGQWRHMVELHVGDTVMSPAVLYERNRFGWGPVAEKIIYKAQTPRGPTLQ